MLSPLYLPKNVHVKCFSQKTSKKIKCVLEFRNCDKNCLGNIFVILAGFHRHINRIRLNNSHHNKINISASHRHLRFSTYVLLGFVFFSVSHNFITKYDFKLKSQWRSKYIIDCNQCLSVQWIPEHISA